MISCEIISICKLGNLRKFKSSKGNDKLSDLLTCTICYLIPACSKMLTVRAKHLLMTAWPQLQVQVSLLLQSKIKQDREGGFFQEEVCLFMLSIAASCAAEDFVQNTSVCQVRCSYTSTCTKSGLASCLRKSRQNFADALACLIKNVNLCVYKISKAFCKIQGRLWNV